MGENTIEKRASRRFRVLKGGTITYDGNGLACTVRNLSSSGAGIELQSAVNLPPSFMLSIETDRFIRRCRPVWSNARRVGVAFE